MFEKIKNLFGAFRNSLANLFNFQFSSRKGYSVTSLWVAGLGFVITVIVLSIGAKIVGKMQAGTEANTTAYTILDTGMQALSELSGWLPIVALAVAGVLVLLLIVRAFGGLGFTVRRGE